MFKLRLEKAEEPGIKLPTFAGSWRKQGSSKQTSSSASSAFDCEYHNKTWKILKKMEVPDQLTGLLRNLYAGQEAVVRARHRTMEWFKIGKGVSQSCTLSSCFIFI